MDSLSSIFIIDMPLRASCEVVAYYAYYEGSIGIIISFLYIFYSTKFEIHVDPRHQLFHHRITYQII